MFSSINIFAVILAAIASTAVGFAWYSPFLFGKQWMQLMGMGMGGGAMDTKSKNLNKIYVISFISDMVIAAALGYILSLQIVFDIKDALMMAAAIWIGVIAPLMLTNNLWENKSWKLFAINIGYRLVAILAMGLVIGWWQ